MPELLDEAVDRWFEGRSPRGAQRAAECERLEDWPIDGEPDVYGCFPVLGERLEHLDPQGVMELLEEPERRARLKTALGYMRFRRRIRLVEWLLSRIPRGRVRQAVERLFAIENGTPQAEASCVLNQSLVFLARQRLIDELFSEARMRRVLRAISDASSGSLAGHQDNASAEETKG